MKSWRDGQIQIAGLGAQCRSNLVPYGAQNGKRPISGRFPFCAPERCREYCVKDSNTLRAFYSCLTDIKASRILSQGNRTLTLTLRKEGTMSTTIGTDMSDPMVFKYWSELAVQDPDRFERERREVIGEAISAAPEDKRERLLRLQWRIDTERARASNPLSACIRLNRMLFESFYAKNGFANTLQASLASIRQILYSGQGPLAIETAAVQKDPYKILPFEKK